MREIGKSQNQRHHEMMSLVGIILICVLIISCGGFGTKGGSMNISADLAMIRTGTYFGECFIHCNETVTFTPGKTSYLLTSNVQDPQYPDISLERKTVRKDWDELRTLIDWGKFSTLPSMIGQPDGADQGGEWVEITLGGEVKRVDFEMNALIPEIDALNRKLREMRKAISPK